VAKGTADLGAKDLRDAGDDAADALDRGVKVLQDADDDVCEAADQERGEPKCANCHLGFSSGDPSEEIDGRLYHRRGCAEYGRQIATAGK
jgi:hypothetical protein